LAFYTERSPVAFWSKKYDAIPENLRSRWFIEKNPRKRFFRSKYFDELMHYLSLRTQKRKQEYANAIALAHPKTDDETAKIQEANRKLRAKLTDDEIAKIQEANRKLQAKLDDISSKKFALEERLNKVNEQYNNISRRIALNNAKIK
jgi:chromosome segregation ATPase